jgi:hypothetical protein
MLATRPVILRGGGPNCWHTVIVRQTDAAELLAVEVFSQAKAAGEPISMELVKRTIADLLAHAAECTCGRCEAAATARAGHVWRVASAWERSTATTRRRAAR